MFTPKTLSFLRSLTRNNDRAWFHANRAEYDTHVHAPMLSVVERLSGDFPKFAPELTADPKISLFRPWRDTRFSEDKTPLKTHVAATFPYRSLGRMNGAGLYFEVAPEWVWIGGGLYSPDTAQLAALREHIAQNHRRLVSIVTSTRFKRLGGLQGDRLTRVPRGFARDHPAAHYLQFRQFLGFREEPATFATRPEFYRDLVATFKQLTPLVRYLNEPIVDMQRTENRAHVFETDELAADRKPKATPARPRLDVETRQHM